MRLRSRIDALENRNPPFRVWHRIMVDVGQTVEGARAAYEAERGPIAESDGIIVREIVG